MDFAELARAFDAEVVWSAAGKSRTPLRFTIEREGASVHAYPELVESDCVGVVFAVESAATRRLPRVVLREEGALDRGGKSLGINEEIQLDDPAFDDAVYVASEAPALAIRELLADSKARAAVVTALAGPAEELVLGDGRVGALIAASELQDPRAAAIEQTLVAISRVAATLVAPSARALRQKSAARSSRALFMLSGSWLALLIVAALVEPPVLLGRGPVWIAFGVGLLLWALCCVGVGVALRGRHDSMRWVVIGAGFFLLVAPVAGTRVTLTLNAVLDGAPANDAVYPARVLETTSYGRALLAVEPASAGDKELRLNLLPGQIEGALPKQLRAVTLTTRPGAFGWPWIVRARAAEPGSDTGSTSTRPNARGPL